MIGLAHEEHFVTGGMRKGSLLLLALNKAARDEIIWHCKHHTGEALPSSIPLALFLRRAWVRPRWLC